MSWKTATECDTCNIFNVVKTRHNRICRPCYEKLIPCKGCGLKLYKFEYRKKGISSHENICLGCRLKSQ